MGADAEYIELSPPSSPGDIDCGLPLPATVATQLFVGTKRSKRRSKGSRRASHASRRPFGIIQAVDFFLNWAPFIMMFLILGIWALDLVPIALLLPATTAPAVTLAVMAPAV